MTQLVDPSGNPISGRPDDAVAAEAQVEARKLRAFLVKRREILTDDQLVSLVSPRARHEIDFPRLKAYFFTIDGMLNGRKVEGALRGGEPMLVFAGNFDFAQELANRGLRKTVELLYKEYDTRQLRDGLSPVAQGLVHETGGRRGQLAQKNPKLQHMIEHLIGGKPWRW